MVKVQPRSADGFVKAPPPDVRAILLYGPDSGLARERMTIAAKSVVPALDDPFLVCEMTGAALASDPARLGDEAAAIAMTGGRRVVLLRELGDGQAAILTDFLADPPGDALIVAVAGDLPARSKLRKAFEASPAGAAIACYADDGAALDRLIDEGLKPLRVRIEPEARQYLTDHLGADRGISRSEIDKLALYAGPDGHLDADTVAGLIGDSAAISADDALFAMTDGNSSALDVALERVSESGQPPPQALLRMAGTHLLRLRRVQDLASRGMPLNTAVKSLKPQVFFKVQSRFEAAVKRWSPAGLAIAMDLAMTAEAATKRTGAPDWALCHRCFHQIAVLARQQGRAAGGGRH